MDVILEKKVKEAIEYINELSDESIDFQLMDPIAKIMLVSMIQECQKIQDYVDGISDKLVERFCECFIPRDKICATPAITLIEPKFKIQKKSDIVSINFGTSFTYKTNGGKQIINYIPLLKNILLPYNNLYILTPNKLYASGKSYDINMNKQNCLWLGINTKIELENLYGLSILINGIKNIYPSYIYIGTEEKKIKFSDLSHLEDLEFIEPFDAQQSSEKFFSIIEHWKEELINIDNSSLIFITESSKDRDLYKPRTYPKIFQNWLESEILDCFDEDTIWLKMEFPDDYIVPDMCSISINVIPVVNIDINSITLTQSTPIAKLQKQEDSYFIQIIETSNIASKQGFNMSTDEIIIRDFDASCYHNGDLYRDIRNLYNHFIDDYYAFIEYNGIKDGEVIKQLRETVNKIGKSVGTINAKYKFDSGTYAMKNMNQYPPTTSTKVSFTTTLGEIGNLPKKGEYMENRKLPSIEKEVLIVVPATGGTNKATVDQRYELLRYYTLTLDRLYTRKDIEAFLRKEIMTAFGKNEFTRITSNISIEGAAGIKKLQRGLYIEIKFRDKKNYDLAKQNSFDKYLQQKISNLSCISMPINVYLKNMEDKK